MEDLGSDPPPADCTGLPGYEKDGEGDGITCN